MLNLEQIQNYYPPMIRENPVLRKFMVKEFVLLMILDFLSTSKFIKKISFIGETNLRLIKGIDRFSEDFDFDCKDFLEEEFREMADAVLTFLNRSGLKSELREKHSPKLTAFRSSIYFPELLFELGLSAHREERFLIKLESQNQEFSYQSQIAMINGCGFFFPFPVPPDEILCAMKISALLSRAKGRDFYDVMFLLAQTPPDYEYLAEKQNIHKLSELKKRLKEIIENTNIEHKAKDFEHLLFNKSNQNKILYFNKFVEML